MVTRGEPARDGGLPVGPQRGPCVLGAVPLGLGYLCHDLRPAHQRVVDAIVERVQLGAQGLEVGRRGGIRHARTFVGDAS